MLGLIFLNSRMRFAVIFFHTFVWIPLLRLKEAILSVASVFRLASLHGELRRNDDRAEKEEECSICLTKYAREDSVYELLACHHVFHLNCIQKWLERNRFTCPLCRCFFNIENRHEKELRFVVPDNPSCLYYFLQ